MNCMQPTTWFGLALLVGLLVPQLAFGQVGPRGMDNPGLGFRGRDMNPAMMPLQAQFSNPSIQSFRTDGRPMMPAAATIAPSATAAMIAPSATPAMIAPSATPAMIAPSATAAMITPSATQVFATVSSVTQLVPNSIQQTTGTALQAARTVALPANPLSVPAQTSQSDAAGVLTLPGGTLEGSSTVVPTDKTPRPIVRIPPAGPASTVHLNSSQIAGFTFVISSCRYAILLDDHPGRYIQGEGGTAFEVTRTGAVVLKEGVALIASGANPLTVTTRLADVKMEADTVALIEAGDFTPCKVTALKSQTNDGIVLSLASGRGSDKESTETFALPAATELVVADHRLTPEELISSDGVDREYRQTLLISSTWHVVKAGLPVARLISSHPLLVAARGDQRLAQCPAIKDLLRQHEGEMQKPSPAVQKQATSDDLIGISYSEPIDLPGLRATRHASLSTRGPGHYQLKQGTIFVDAAQALRVDTPTASVFAAPHSVLVISADDLRTQVLNLHDQRMGAVKLLVGKSYVPVGPGSEARVLNEQSVKARPLALGDGIGRRRMRVIPGADNVNVVVNEFSIPDALVAHPVLKQFSVSHHAPDRLLVNKIVKTAAAVACATAGSREVYSSAAMR